MKFYGTLLSPKYIDIIFNEKYIKAIDLRLILGAGSLNDWAKKCDLPLKLNFFPVYS